MVRGEKLMSVISLYERLHQTRTQQWQAKSNRWNELVQQIMHLIESDELLNDMDKEIICYSVIENIYLEHLIKRTAATTGCRAYNHARHIKQLAKQRDN